MNKLTFVCTDKGQHPERPIGQINDSRGMHTGRAARASGEAQRKYIILDTRVQATEERTRVTADGDHRTVRAESLTVTKRKDGRKMYVPTCQTCRRSPELSEAQVETLFNAGVLRVDISRLPF